MIFPQWGDVNSTCPVSMVSFSMSLWPFFKSVASSFFGDELFDRNLTL
jgi:hypothetical protein